MEYDWHHLVAHMRDLEAIKKLQKEDGSKLTLAAALKEAKSAVALDDQLTAQRNFEAATNSSKPPPSGFSTRGRQKGPNVSTMPSSRFFSIGTSHSQSRACSGCGAEPAQQCRDCPAWRGEGSSVNCAAK